MKNIYKNLSLAFLMAIVVIFGSTRMVSANPVTTCEGQECYPSPTLTVTPTLTATPTPICTGTRCIDIECDGGGECEVVIPGCECNVTPTLAPAASPSATPTEEPSDSTSTNTDESSDTPIVQAATSTAPEAAEMAPTGTFSVEFMNIMFGLGVLSLSGGSILYGKTKKS